MASDAISVRHVPQESSFHLLVGGERRGLLDYRRTGDRWTLTHTEVDPEYQNRGLAAKLVSGALDEIRAENGHIVPLCPYIPVFLRRHPEYADLVAR